MQNHLSRGPVSAQQLKALATKRDTPAIARAVFHLASLIATGGLLWQMRETLWAIPLLPAYGYVFAFLFCIEHETAHRTAFKTRWLNTVLGHFAGFVLLLPFEAYRAFHWDHHRYTQDPDRDPELSVPLPRSRIGLFWVWLGAPNLLNRVKPLLRHATGSVDAPWINASSRPRVVREARIYFAGYALLIGALLWLQPTALLWLWLAPLITGYWFLRPYLLAEHTGCSHAADMLENTRTTFTNPMVRAFAWNMPYHTEHHAYPAVPFHALPALHELMADRLVNTERGYVRAAARVVEHIDSLADERAAKPSTAL